MCSYQRRASRPSQQCLLFRSPVQVQDGMMLQKMSFINPHNSPRRLRGQRESATGSGLNSLSVSCVHLELTVKSMWTYWTLWLTSWCKCWSKALCQYLIKSHVRALEDISFWLTTLITGAPGVSFPVSIQVGPCPSWSSRVSQWQSSQGCWRLLNSFAACKSVACKSTDWAYYCLKHSFNKLPSGFVFIYQGHEKKKRPLNTWTDGDSAGEVCYKLCSLPFCFSRARI